MKKKIDIYLQPPYLMGNEKKYINDAIDSNWISPYGDYVLRLENIIKKTTNSKYALLLNSGTSAIHLALKCLNISRFDFVICPSFTFAGTAFPILYEKGIPIFIDSDKFWNIDPNILRDCLKKYNKKRKKIKAVISVNTYGMPCNYKDIKNICKEFSVPLIEDAAESVGSKFNNQQTGSFGDIGIFSFNGNKLLTTSAGGCLLTNNKNFYEKAKILSNQSKLNKPYYYHKDIGYNYRMSNILASIGFAQFQDLKEKIRIKRKIHSYYRNKITKYLDIFDIHDEYDNENKYESNFWLNSIIIKNKKKTSKEKIINALKNNKIESRLLWKPLHTQPVFKKFKFYGSNICNKLYLNGISLPSGSDLTMQQLDNITNILLKTVK